MFKTDKMAQNYYEVLPPRAHTI